MAYLISEFLTDVRNSGKIPTTETDAVIVVQADRELQTRILPMVLSVREEYFACDYYTATIANVSRYKIPRRAIGSRIRELWLQRSDGTFSHLERLEPAAAATLNPSATGEPTCFWVKGGDVMLHPKPADATAYLRWLIYARPGRLQTSNSNGTNYCVITSITSNGTTYTINVGNDIASMTGLRFDIVSPDSGFEIRAVDVLCASQGTNTYSVTVAGAPPDLAIATFANDYIVPAETSVFIPLPVELHGVLVQATVARMLKNGAYLDEAAEAERDVERMAADAMRILTPRTDGAPRKLSGGILDAQRANWPIFGWR